MQPAIPALTNFMVAVGGTSGGFRPTMVAEELEGEKGFVEEPGWCIRTEFHVGVLFGGRSDDVPWWLLMASEKPKNLILPCLIASLPEKLRHRACSAWDSPVPTIPYPTPAITGVLGEIISPRVTFPEPCPSVASP